MNEQSVEHSTHTKVLVLTPDPQRLRPEVLTKPFILYAQTHYSTKISNIVGLPSVMELMGGSSGGGGPPGFCATQTLGAVKEPHLTLIAGFLPGSEVAYSTQWFQVLEVLGGVSSAAVVTTYMRLEAVEDDDPDVDLETTKGVEEYIKNAGYTPIPLVEYKTPQAILNAIVTQRSPAHAG